MPRPSCGTIDVHTHKDGQQTFYLRMTVDGRRRRVRLGTDRAGWTMGKAMVALEEQLATVRTGTWRPSDEPDARSEADDPTFRAFASSWLEDNMLEWRPNTVNDVRWRLQSHLLPQIGEDRLSTFDIPRVTAVKTAMLRESRRIADAIDSGVIERDAHNNPLRPLSNESINKCLALLARILDDAVERGYLADNPARRVRRLRHHRPRRPVLQDHELNAMLHAADRLDLRRADLGEPVAQVAARRAQGDTYQQIADHLQIAISTVHYRLVRFAQATEPVAYFRIWVRALATVGLRIDEACRARRCDVDLLAGCLHVAHAKTAAGVRSVELTPHTATDLKRYLAMTAERPDDGPLLPTLNGTFHNRNNVAKRVVAPLVTETNAVLSERGQPKLPDGITAHSLRKTYFTLMHYSDAIPRWLADQGGHRDPSTTLGIYTEALRGERGGYGAAFDALVDEEPPPKTGALNPEDDDSA